MRKFGKAILSAVLAVAICLSSLTFTASAVENSKLTDEQIETLMQSASLSITAITCRRAMTVQRNIRSYYFYMVQANAEIII